MRLCVFGYEVRVVSFFRSYALPCYPLDSCISCVYLSNRPAKAKNVLITLLNKMIFRVWLCLKVHKLGRQSDIILANDGWFVPLFKGINHSRERFFVRLWHINAPKRARKKLRLFDALVILSGREMERWQRYHSNVRVIPNFLPTIPQVATNHSQKVVLTVGRMSSEKGFLRLLDIWKMVQTKIKDSPSLAEGDKGDGFCCAKMESTHPLAPSAKEGEIEDLSQWKLIIVGDGVLKNEIESKIHALNLGESVFLKPFTKDIEREYLNASIYAMASHFEGFPMVLLESTAYGLAPISFDIATGPSDIIENNKSGFLIADNDLETYANHLIKLMSDENLRTQFGAESRKIISENFSKEVVMEKWRDLFEK